VQPICGALGLDASGTIPLAVDCPSNRLNGRLTLQEGFNRALRLSAFMSSSSRQRPYPIPPLLPQLAERMLKISQMLVLNHFYVLSPLSDMRRASVAPPPTDPATSFAAPAWSVVASPLRDAPFKGSNESAKMLMILETFWLIGLEPKALHGLFGQRSDDAIHLAAARARCLNGQMGCVG
jgi:hypothetical protein